MKYSYPKGTYGNYVKRPGELEYGFIVKKLDTEVYKGWDEASTHIMRKSQPVYTRTDSLLVSASASDIIEPAIHAHNEKWSHFTGHVMAEDEIVELSLFVRSGYIDESDGNIASYCYFFNVVNDGYPLIVDWMGSGYLAELLKQMELSLPLSVEDKGFNINIDCVSEKPPIRKDVPISISYVKGDREIERIRAIAPVYVPED